MANDIDQLSIEVTADTSDAEQGIGGLSSLVDSEFAKMAGAATGAAGVMAEAFARSQQSANVELGRLATATNMTEGELRSLVGELDNVTFSTGDVVAVLANASQQGIRTADDMAHFARTWDLVADATGESVVELSAAGVALRALNIDDPADALDAFGFIAQETTGSVGDFLTFVERTGPQLRDMGLTVDDTAAIMGVLERELGMTGRIARTEFRKAVNEADGSLDAMLATLGVSPESFDAMRDSVAGSAEVLERNAQIYADSHTPLQRLQSFVGETVFQFGGMADAAGIAGGALTTLSAPLLAVSHAGPAMSALSAGTHKVKGAMTLLKGAMVAHPILTLAAVAGGVAAAFGLLGGRSDDARQRVDALADAMRNAASAAEGLNNFLRQTLTDVPELTAAMDAAGLKLSDLESATANGGDELQEFNRRLREGADELGMSSFHADLLVDGVNDLADSYVDATDHNATYNAVAGETSMTLAEAALSMDAARAAADAQTASMADLADELDEVAVAAAATEAAQKVMEDAFAEIEAAADAVRSGIDSAMDAAVRSIFRFSDESKTSLDSFREEMGQNVLDLVIWQNNLKTIAERAGGEFATEMAQYGPEFSGMIDELANLSDDEFQAFVGEMGFATEMMTRDMAEEFGEVDPEFKKVLDGVAGMTDYEMFLLRTEARNAAREVGHFMVAGMEGGIQARAHQVADAAARMVSNAMSAARREGEIRSPSELFAREVGEPIADGIALGVEREVDRTFEPAMARVMSNITASFTVSPNTGSSVTGVHIENMHNHDDADVESVFRAANLIMAGAS